MTPLSVRRQAREFARAVDTDTGKAASDLAAPLQVVTLLRAMPPVEPDPAFMSGLRDQLLDAAASRVEPDSEDAPDEAPSNRGRTPWQQRGLAIAASTLVIVGAGTGTAAVSQHALPGDLLYPVKRSIERVELQLARGDSGKGTELLDQASTRLDEVEALTTENQSPDPEQIAELNQAFSDFTSQTTEGGRRLIAAYATDDDANAIGRIRVFTTQAATQLANLAPAMLADLRTSFTKAAGTVGSLDGLAVRICPTCGGPLPLVSVPGEVLSAEPFLVDAPGVDLSNLPTTGAGGSDPVTLPGGPPVTGVPTSPLTTPTATTTAVPTPSDGITPEPTSGLTTGSSSESPAASVSPTGDVLTPLPTLLPEDPATIEIPIP
jgi:Domain of unknown function (DUF5667)